jgi:hypothetical protein
MPIAPANVDLEEPVVNFESQTVFSSQEVVIPEQDRAALLQYGINDEIKSDIVEVEMVTADDENIVFEERGPRTMGIWVFLGVVVICIIVILAGIYVSIRYLPKSHDD